MTLRARYDRVCRDLLVLCHELAARSPSAGSLSDKLQVRRASQVFGRMHLDALSLHFQIEDADKLAVKAGAA